MEAHSELTQQMLERNRDLIAAGYHAQVHVEEQTSFVFLLENGKRLTLRRNGQDYAQNGRRFSTEELMERAASLSPNALLRPVVQDSMLPTVAYIIGPAEAAYLAQSEVLYRTVLGRMPVVVPRTGFTILDHHSDKLMDRYGLSLPDFFQGEDVLRERIATKLVPPALSGAHWRDAGKAVDQAHRTACAPAWRRSTPRWRRRSTAAAQDPLPDLAKSKARPDVRPCAATNAPRATRRRSTA